MARRRQDTPEEAQRQREASSRADRFRQRKSWFATEMGRQQANRYQMALDEDYYDSIQWTPDEAAAVRARGQNPIVYNEVKPTIDWLIGTERRMRRDFKVLARNDRSQEASADAQVKTKLLKYLDDVNRTPFERSLATDDSWKGGLGVIEVGVRSDPEDEAIYVRSESWRNCLYDSLGTRRDGSDWRYFFRFKEVDLDVAIAYFPDKEAELTKAAASFDDSSFRQDWFNGYPVMGPLGDSRLPAKWVQYDSESWVCNPRKRVLLIECWHFRPTRRTTGLGAGMHDRTFMQMHVAIDTEFDTLLETPSPYRHNRYPFVLVWAYRRKRDGAPYGPIRPVRGPQDDLNKRMSKSQFMLSVNQLRVEAGAIDDEAMTLDQIREEMAAPDGITIFANGALSGGKVQVRDHMDIAQGHLALAERDIAAIRSVTSVNEENRGLRSGATSRVAMDARADRGSTGTAELFDNLMFAHQLEGELTLSLIEQYYTEPKVFSVTGDRYKLEYYEINNTDPVTGQKHNDVTARKAQYVIDEAPWRASLAEAAFEQAMAMLGQLAPVAPQAVIAILDLVFEWSDLPNKHTIVQRIRQATGMSDPEKGETPEQQAAKAQEQAMKQAQFEAEMAQLQASIREAQAKGEKLDAEAMAKRLEAVYMAAQAAQVIAQVPAVTPIADELLKSSGFKDAAGPGGAVIDGQQPVAPPAQPAAALPEPLQGDGAQAGIQTPAPDGVRLPPQPLMQEQ